MMKISIAKAALAAFFACVSIPVVAEVQPTAKLAVGIDAKPFIPRFARVEQAAQTVSMDLCDRPVYPKSSLRNEETGTVVLRFKIAASGLIIDNTIARSSGFRELDKSAFAGFSTCKFRPATIDGRAVPAFAFISYVFTLE